MINKKRVSRLIRGKLGENLDYKPHMGLTRTTWPAKEAKQSTADVEDRQLRHDLCVRGHARPKLRHMDDRVDLGMLGQRQSVHHFADAPSDLKWTKISKS